MCVILECIQVHILHFLLSKLVTGCNADLILLLKKAFSA